MTAELQKIHDDLDKERATLQATYDAARVKFDKVDEKIRPLEIQLREHEAAMDAVKPRLAELTAKLEKLKLAL